MKNQLKLGAWHGLVAVALGMGLATSAMAGTLAYWDFNDSNLVVDQGAGTLTTTVESANVMFFTGSTMNALPGVSAGSAVAFQGGTGQINNGRTMTITVNAGTASDLVLSLWTQRTSTGFTTVDVAYDIGGGPVAVSSYMPVVSPGSVQTINLPAAVDGQASVAIILTFTGATSDTGNNRLDNVLIDATLETGACCVGLACSITDEPTCLGMGGTYLGGGSVCTPLPCGPPGSCCSADFTCTDDVTAEQCTALDPAAVWTSGGTCAVDCAAPTGSCCLLDGSCVLDVTEADCTAQRGRDWTEDGVDCPGCAAVAAAPVIISEYYESAPGNRKALELFNPTATPADLHGHSLALYANLSTTPTNTFMLDGLTINGFQTLVFINNTADDIPNFDEMGPNAVVAPSVCSFNGDDAVALLFDGAMTPTVLDAFAIPGQADAGPRALDPYIDSAWERQSDVSAGTADFDPCNFDGLKDCMLAECPPGTPVTCTDGANADEWTFEGRNPVGNNDQHTLGAHNFGTDLGACCVGLSCSITNAATCAGMGGTFQGVATSCTPLPCGATGSCCAPDFTCTDGVTQPECTAINPAAIWTSGGTCAANCIAPTGACCLPSGVCQVLAQTPCESMGGTYQGNGVACGSVMCPQPNLNLIISEIVDGNLPGGLPKWVEITNRGGTAVDLSGYTVGIYSNASTSLGGAAVRLAGMLAAGDSYVLDYESDPMMPNTSVFATTYGFEPDQYTTAPTFNGDDVAALFFGPQAATGDGSNAFLVDIYGVVGQIAPVTWAYDDSYSFRVFTVTTGNPNFTESEWYICGSNCLVGADAAEDLTLLQQNTTPGVHTGFIRPTADSQFAAAFKNTDKSITLTGDRGNKPGAVLNFRIQSLPALGTLLRFGSPLMVGSIVPSDGAITYQPTTDATGLDSFTFDVWNGIMPDTDPENISLTATVEVAVQNTGTVFITEIMANPSGGNDADPNNPQEEFIEIYNPSGATVTLGHLGDQANSAFPAAAMDRNLDGITIGPMSALVIAHSHQIGAVGSVPNDTFLDSWSGLNSSNTKFITDLQWPFLNNGGDRVFLYDNAGGLLDLVDYTNQATFPDASLSSNFGSIHHFSFSQTGSDMNSQNNDSGARWALYPSGETVGDLTMGRDSCAGDRGSPLWVEWITNLGTNPIPPTALCQDVMATFPMGVNITLQGSGGTGALTYVVTQLPAGTLTQIDGFTPIMENMPWGSNMVRYTPSAIGSDSFRFRVTDTNGSPSNNGTVSIMTTGDCNGTFPAGLVINEFDTEQVGVDTMEFVELYNGTGAAIDFDMDPFVMVFFNGNGDTSYRVHQLTGMLADGGYYVVGSAAVPGVRPGQTIPDGVVQNGPDAVAIYTGCSFDWPNGTAATVTPAVGQFGDALVYGTADADDPELLAIFGGIQYDDTTTGSIALIPNGNTMDMYEENRTPTPNANNELTPTEACCFPDGSCQDLVAGDCATMGGTPQGTGSTCASTMCPQPCTAPVLMGARSVAMHTAGEFYVDLDITDNPATRTSESRSSGIQIVDLGFDQPILSGSITVTPGGATAPITPGAGTFGANGGRADLGAALTNQAVYTITINATTGPTCDLAQDICVVALVGDFNDDDRVTAADKAELIGFVFQTVAQANAKYDIQVGGGTVINVVDVGAWTGFFGGNLTAQGCP